MLRSYITYFHPHMSDIMQQPNPLDIQDPTEIFSEIYSKTNGYPYTFDIGTDKHTIMSVPGGRGTSVQTITYTFNGISSIILLNPDTKEIQASIVNVGPYSPEELTKLLVFLKNNISN